MTVDEIAKSIKSHPKNQKTILVAIDGFGGSGKSTIAEQLNTALGNAFVIGIDDFIVKEKLTERSPEQPYFDRSRLQSQVLEPVKNGSQIKYQRLEWVENRLSEPIEVPLTDYLIVEGITTFHPDISDYFDYKIWVDTPIEIAKQRGHARDGSNENAKYWELWSSNDLAYQTKYHPEKQADFVIINS